MTFKFASLNVENLFDRPKIFLMGEFEEGDRKLATIRRLQALIVKRSYSADEKKWCRRTATLRIAWRLSNRMAS